MNTRAESGGLDPLQVKAIFYALYFGDDAPTRRAAANFVECFYRLEERTDTTTDVLEDGTVVVQTTVYYGRCRCHWKRCMKNWRCGRANR